MLTWVEDAPPCAIAAARSLTVRFRACARASRSYTGAMSSDRDTLAGNGGHPRRNTRPGLEQELGQCSFISTTFSEHTFSAKVALAIFRRPGMAQDVDSTEEDIFHEARKLERVFEH